MGNYIDEFTKKVLSWSLEDIFNENLYTNQAFDFVVRIVRQLLFRREDSVEWIRRSKIDPAYYFPLILQRLVVLLAVMCLNSRKYCDFMNEVLYDNNIWFPLPSKVRKLLKLAAVRHGYLDVSQVAEALKLLEDPLIIVCSSGCSPSMRAPAAIVIGMDNLQHDDTLDVLFPNESTNRVGGNGQISADGSSLNSVISSPMSQIEGTSQRSMEIVFDWDSFVEVHKYFKADSNKESVKCILSDLKEKMEGSLNCLAAVLSLSVGSQSDGGINYIDEINNLHEDLIQLSRNEELEGNVMQIKQLLESVLSRRPLLESFFDHVLSNEQISCQKQEVDAQCSKQDGVSRTSMNAGNWNALCEDNNSKKQAPGKGKGKGKGRGKGKSKGRKR